MNTQAATPGLRERKRAATRRAIQCAALTLVAEHGLAGVTVDQISDRAGVSPRTFFNYFGTKEDALMADAPHSPSEAAIEEFVAGGDGLDMMAAIGALFADSAQSASLDAELLRLRRRVAKLQPELLALTMANMRRLETELIDIVERRLRFDRATAAADEPAVDDPAVDDVAIADRARLIAMVALSVSRYAWYRWTERAGGRRLDEEVREAFESVRELAAMTSA